MIEGQYLDLEYETRRAVGVGEYLTMVEHKTGALLGCSLALGALLAGGDRDVRRPAGARGPLSGIGLPDPRRRAGHLGRQRRHRQVVGQRHPAPQEVVPHRLRAGTRRPRRRRAPATTPATPAIHWRASTSGTPSATGRRSATPTCATSYGRSTPWARRRRREQAAGVHYDGFLAALAGCGCASRAGRRWRRRGGSSCGASTKESAMTSSRAATRVNDRQLSAAIDGATRWLLDDQHGGRLLAGRARSQRVDHGGVPAAHAPPGHRRPGGVGEDRALPAASSAPGGLLVAVVRRPGRA